MYSRFCYLTTTAGCFGKNPCCSFLFFSGASFRARVVTIKNKLKDSFSSRGCFGCLTKPSVVVTVEEPAKRLGNQDRSVWKYSTSDDFWSSSAAEMEHGMVKPQRSLSSVSSLNRPLDFCCNPSSTNNASEFVNHGSLLWNQMRQHWLGNKRSGNRSLLREPTISWNATYESLLGTNKPFRRPVPLTEMVDFLVDVWEQEGFYGLTE